MAILGLVNEMTNDLFFAVDEINPRGCSEKPQPLVVKFCFFKNIGKKVVFWLKEINISCLWEWFLKVER